MKNLFLLFALFSFSIVASSYSLENIPTSAKNALVYPVSGKKSSVGGYWGEYRNGNRRHKGVDIYARKGTPVVAVSDGIVTAVTNGGKGGKCIWVKSASHPWTAYYAHLDKQKVRSGQFVKRGQVVGTVGNTGNARYTPSHLHFGIYKENEAVNPLPYIKKSPKIVVSAPKQTTSKKASTGSRAKKTAKNTTAKTSRKK
jgi:murein DD-endopeptidase MepM/ murein hydrolase activator NlpD